MKKMILIIMLMLITKLVFAEKDTIVVVDIQSKVLPETNTLLASEILRDELFKLNEFNVIDRNSMLAIFREKKLQLMGCVKNECALEIGKLLNAKYIIVGNIQEIKEMKYLSIKVVSVNTGKITYSFARMFINIKSLPFIISLFVMKYLDKDINILEKEINKMEKRYREIYNKALLRGLVKFKNRKEYVIMAGLKAQKKEYKDDANIGFTMGGVGIGLGALVFMMKSDNEKEREENLIAGTACMLMGIGGFIYGLISSNKANEIEEEINL